MKTNIGYNRRKDTLCLLVPPIIHNSCEGCYCKDTYCVRDENNRILCLDRSLRIGILKGLKVYERSEDNK